MMDLRTGGGFETREVAWLTISVGVGTVQMSDLRGRVCLDEGWRLEGVAWKRGWYRECLDVEVLMKGWVVWSIVWGGWGLGMGKR